MDRPVRRIIASVISLPIDDLLDLPVDQLGLLILKDLIDTKEWNEYNYLLGARHAFPGAGAEAVAEALAWLRARALISRNPTQNSDAAIIVTRTGRRIAADGVPALHALDRLQGATHLTIESEVRPLFLIGQYESAVLAAMKKVEVRVRQLAGLGNDVVGVTLMNHAFGPGGPLTDATMVKGEQEGTRALFAGAYAVFRNPSSHREVDFDDVSEAAEMIYTASLLMRILDRIERRLSEPANA